MLVVELNVADQRLIHTCGMAGGQGIQLGLQRECRSQRGQAAEMQPGSQHRGVRGSSPAGTEITGHTHHPLKRKNPASHQRHSGGFLPQVLPLMPPLGEGETSETSHVSVLSRESDKKPGKLPNGTATCGRTHGH